jgi:cytidine deaminase
MEQRGRHRRPEGDALLVAEAPGAPDEATLQALFAVAQTARTRAYAPYSRFRVGAAVLAESGAIYAGCNVENVAFPVGTCAEAGAIAAMVAAGETRIRAVLVLGEGPEPVMPCGACRQRLSEFGAVDTPVHCAGAGGARRSFRLGALLPAAFGPGALPAPEGA